MFGQYGCYPVRIVPGPKSISGERRTARGAADRQDFRTSPLAESRMQGLSD